MLIYSGWNAFWDFENKTSPAWNKYQERGMKFVEPKAGIEPAAYSLRVNCSTPEPLWRAIKIYIFGS